MDPRLKLRMQLPAKGERVLTPTEPWESWAVFAYNSVVPGSGSRPHRMYYDCIEGDGVPPGAADDVAASEAGRTADISHRRICLAESADGVAWTKPNLGIFARNGSTANNILLEDSGNSVFQDADGSWKMVCSTAAYKSPDGLHWTKLPFVPVAEDDTKPTAYWDPQLRKYVVSVRRDCGSGCVTVDGEPVTHASCPECVRYVGRCVTSNISNWQEEVHGGSGCPVVFGPDHADPGRVDVYTNAWTPYPSVEAPVVHLFFPSMYHHFTSSAPFGFGNDGLLDIRLVVSRDGAHVNYTTAENGRSPWVPLGVNKCGPGAHAPDNPNGWCSPKTGIEAGPTAFDTSAMYMASGYVPSNDGDEIYFFSSGQAFTHGGDAATHSWGNNSGIRRLTARKDGFVAVEAPYLFNEDISRLPSLTTVKVKVPSTCPPPQVNTTACERLCSLRCVLTLVALCCRHTRCRRHRTRAGLGALTSIQEASAQKRCRLCRAKPTATANCRCAGKPARAVAKCRPAATAPAHPAPARSSAGTTSQRAAATRQRRAVECSSSSTWRHQWSGSSR